MEWQVVTSAVIFLLVYAIIISEKIHRTIIALVGAVSVIILGIITQEQAIQAIDFNTIGLLTGMMIVVGITRRSGVFEYVAIRAAQYTKGDPLKIMVALCMITALASAFLDNVTTVLLLVPVTFSLCDELEINPIPFLIAEIISSNIGGTATLIGDPPNIMIGGGAGLGFMDFVTNLAPVVLIVFVVTIALLAIIFRKSLVVAPEKQQRIMVFNPADFIKDYTLLKKSLVVLALVIIGFILHQSLHLESATVALAGAALLMLLARDNEPEEVLLTVEWPTIFFFIGLFILVGSLEEVGIIESIARETLNLTHGNQTVTAMTILWMSAIASAFVDNIPFTATMIPLIKSMGQLSGMQLDPLWWSLALGACLGGNGTLIGASANLVVAGMSSRRGVVITFMQYLRYGFPLMLVSIVISTAYIYLRYLM
ncbi:ArsB/NhaD family transporter [Syntrophomonas curvata]